MIYSEEVEHMCPVVKGTYHRLDPIPKGGEWVQGKEIVDIYCLHSDAQFAGSSSVPAHVEMMGLLGMSNNLMGATVAVDVAISEAIC